MNDTVFKNKSSGVSEEKFSVLKTVSLGTDWLSIHTATSICMEWSRLIGTTILLARWGLARKSVKRSPSNVNTFAGCNMGSADGLCIPLRFTRKHASYRFYRRGKIYPIQDVFHTDPKTWPSSKITRNRNITNIEAIQVIHWTLIADILTEFLYS